MDDGSAEGSRLGSLDGSDDGASLGMSRHLARLPGIVKIHARLSPDQSQGPDGTHPSGQHTLLGSLTPKGQTSLKATLQDRDGMLDGAADGGSDGVKGAAQNPLVCGGTNLHSTKRQQVRAGSMPLRLHG